MGRSSRTQVSIGLGLGVLLFSAGCVNLPTFGPPAPPDLPPTTAVTSSYVTWESKVRFLEDIVHGGKLTPGMAGSLYLFSANLAPAQANGIVQIELYDVSQCQQGQRPEKPLESLRIDKDSLKNCLGKDGFGLWRYTLFMPWSTYRSDITKVVMVVSYVPAQGAPVFAPTSTVDLSGATGVVRQQQVPAGTPALSNRGTPRDAGVGAPGAVPHLEAPPSTTSTRIALPADRQSAFNRLVPQ
jgi:hypothetical protein